MRMVQVRFLKRRGNIQEEMYLFPLFIHSWCKITVKSLFNQCIYISLLHLNCDLFYFPLSVTAMTFNPDDNSYEHLVVS